MCPIENQTRSLDNLNCVYLAVIVMCRTLEDNQIILLKLIWKVFIGKWWQKRRQKKYCNYSLQKKNEGVR